MNNINFKLIVFLYMLIINLIPNKSYLQWINNLNIIIILFIMIAYVSFYDIYLALLLIMAIIFNRVLLNTRIDDKDFIRVTI